MPTHDGIRMDDDQRRAPFSPRVGEQHPEQSISIAEWRTLGTFEHGQLLPEGQILTCHRSVSAANQRDCSEKDEHGQHELSCGATGHGIKRLGGRSLILANHRLAVEIESGRVACSGVC